MLLHAAQCAQVIIPETNCCVGGGSPTASTATVLSYMHSTFSSMKGSQEKFEVVPIITSVLNVVVISSGSSWVCGREWFVVFSFVLIAPR